MKKIVKIIFYLLIVVTISIPCFMVINTKADTKEKAEKGDLRCPLELDENVTCVPKYSSNGKVSGVELTYEDADIVVKKIVTKKSTLGRYDVEFRVRGKGKEQIKTMAPAYIMVVVDMSATISGKISNMKSAVKTFGRTLIPNNDGTSNFYLGLIQFASNVSVRQKFKNTNFNNTSFLGYNSGGLGKKSHVEKAYSKANSLFKDVPANALKYLLIFGDGRYWSNADTDTGKIIPNANTLKKNGVTIYGARYHGSCYKSSLGRLNSAIRLGCKAGKSYDVCDETVMKKIVSDKKYYSPRNDWDKLFQEIATEIKGSVGENALSYYADLSDEIGDEFYLPAEDEERYKHFDVGELTTTEKKFGPFEIEINSDAAEGWHETNENVSFSYSLAGDPEKKYTIKNNPEVYWVPTSTALNSCSDSVTADSSRSQDKDIYSYYTKTCTEGYYEGSNYRNGYTASVVVNNLSKGTKSFGLVSGRGFPTDITLSTNMLCTYTFNTDKYKKDYQEIQDKLKTETDSKEIASLTVRQGELDDILKNYIEITKLNDLKEYKERFIKQSAYLTVKYDNSTNYSIVEFVNSKTSEVLDPNCNSSSTKSETINGKTVETNKVCKVSFKKEMKLPESCLDMQSGDAISCSPEDALLTGGNEFYIDKKATSGQVIVEINGAGYRGNIKFSLDKDDKGDPVCTFNNSNKKLVFRQIELEDPFLTNYDPLRGVGKNYLNNKFDFTKIIQDDIWSREYMYAYTLSKVNVDNIKKDTAEDRASSYLGRNCYFTSTNKYVCEFTRNGGSNEELVGDKNLFNSVDIKGD